MTFTIDFPDDQLAALQAKAQAEGISAEQYVRRLLSEDIKPNRRHISEVIRDRMNALPPEAFAGLPADGASQHDHYIYGLPKREDL